MELLYTSKVERDVQQTHMGVMVRCLQTVARFSHSCIHTVRDSKV